VQTQKVALRQRKATCRKRQHGGKTDSGSNAPASPSHSLPSLPGFPGKSDFLKPLIRHLADFPIPEFIRFLDIKQDAFL
jgi:hypothetical protein